MPVLLSCYVLPLSPLLAADIEGPSDSAYHEVQRMIQRRCRCSAVDSRCARETQRLRSSPDTTMVTDEYVTLDLGGASNNQLVTHLMHAVESGRCACLALARPCTEREDVQLQHANNCIVHS